MVKKIPKETISIPTMVTLCNVFDFTEIHCVLVYAAQTFSSGLRSNIGANLHGWSPNGTAAQLM